MDNPLKEEPNFYPWEPDNWSRFKTFIAVTFALLMVPFIIVAFIVLFFYFKLYED